VKARLAEVNEAYHVLASRAFRREYDQVWMELAAKPSSILEPENEDEEPTPAPPPPLAVMAKQQARARSPRPKEAPKTRLSVRKFLRAFGLLASFWIIVAVSLATSVS
jgi:curved DNA-binding protein CbpA